MKIDGLKVGIILLLIFLAEAFVWALYKISDKE